jgi:hypothetical protein
MGSVFDVINEYSADMSAVQTFCDELYDQNFKSNFEEIRELYTRLKSKVHPITDEELEYILTTFPLELFVVSENLNKLRLNCEVVKLKNKQTMETIRKNAEVEADSLNMTKSAKNDYVSNAIKNHMVEYEVLYSAYSSVISRVENEQAFAKELIMGAKKIWDSRRSADNSNPISPVVPDLPEYDKFKNKTPIY